MLQMHSNGRVVLQVYNIRVGLKIYEQVKDDDKKIKWNLCLPGNFLSRKNTTKFTVYHATMTSTV